MLQTLWRGSKPLTVTGLAMAGVLALTMVGLAVDSRMVTGAPVWLKPAKFASSIAIYSFTLAWMFSFLDRWPRTTRIVGWTTAAAMVLEMAIIGGQAARGAASHFNAATPLDLTLFSIMGVAIVVQTLSTIAVAVALWRNHFADQALGWAMRLGMTITIVGAFAGGLMASPTRQQLDAARAGQAMTVAGAHTVGAPDGGPGLPGTGWSTTHGDLRVAHFVGLHALQALPIVAVLIRRRKMAEAAPVRLIKIAGASYAGVFAILLTQALRGQSVLSPDVTTLMLFALLALATGVAVTIAARQGGVRWHNRLNGSATSHRLHAALDRAGSR
ncbi:MAG TPA: hypothetical protein VJ691_07610 [Vicinamibacterales bacterium]|nr:hypothetical protein [Vicinamibacterales bacterium]